MTNPCKILNVSVQDKCKCNLQIIQHWVSEFLSTKYQYLVYKNECTFGLTCLVVTSILVMGAPLWSLMTRTVIPVVGLLTAISPSLPPDIIILPVNEEYLEWKYSYQHQDIKTIFFNPVKIRSFDLLTYDYYTWA